MCLIAFAYRQIENQPLLLIANRDEDYRRPTKALHPWQNHTGIIAPQDQHSGGSWIGFNQYQQWIAITNIRVLPPPRPQQSRGLIFSQYLNQHTSAEAFCHYLHQEALHYNPFNALIGDAHHLFFFSSQHGQPQRLTPGVYGLSNASLDTPWPKLVRLKNKLKHLLSTNTRDDSALWSILHDTTQAKRDQLPQTGLTPELEQQRSSIFIESQDYGTRSSYILTQRRTLQLQERVYVP